MVPECNSSCNSYRNFSVKNRILKFISDSDYALKPKEISEKLGLNHNTVRIYLRRLLRDGKIVQPYDGAYCNKITYGVLFVPLLCHNVRLRFFVGVDLESWKKTEVVGGVKIHVCFGSERRKVSGFLACDVGMSKDACLLSLQRWFDIVEKRLGRPVPDTVEVQTVEFNKDYVGIRLDGISCVTKQGLFESLERIYQKEEDVVRHEHKVSQKLTVPEFESLLNGGVSAYNFHQQLFMVLQKVDELTKSNKFLSGQVLQLTRITEALVKKQWKKNDEIEGRG